MKPELQGEYYVWPDGSKISRGYVNNCFPFGNEVIPNIENLDPAKTVILKEVGDKKELLVEFNFNQLSSKDGIKALKSVSKRKPGDKWTEDQIKAIEMLRNSIVRVETRNFKKCQERP